MEVISWIEEEVDLNFGTGDGNGASSWVETGLKLECQPLLE